jgi:cytochrome bd ubiquinol oxidase subunit II
MVAYFRIRALVAGVVSGVVALVGMFVMRSDAKYIFDGLTSRALPLVVVSAIAGVVALVLLRGRPRPGGRVAAVVAAGALVLGWGVAQWDYLLPETLTVSQAGAPAGTITAVLVAAVLAVLLIVPAFALLYTLDQKGLLPEEGVEELPDQATGSRTPDESLSPRSADPATSSGPAQPQNSPPFSSDQ